jgi:hypothetical protein
MPRYVIERQFLVPIFEHVMVEAADLASACRTALEETAQPWGDHSTVCYDDARPVTVALAVELPEEMLPELHAGGDLDHYTLNDLVYQSGLEPLPIPVDFTNGSLPRRPIGFA